MKDRIKTALVLIAVIAAYIYVSNDDYKTLKLECQTGIRICNLSANY